MNIQNAFPSKWLKSGDCEDQDLTLTIREVLIEEVGSGDNQEQKPVIYFEETDKGMVLNKTNADTISKLHTPETDNWIGKKITIFATEVDFAGKQTLALRVRMRAPKSALPVTPQPNGKRMAQDAVTTFWAFIKLHPELNAADLLTECGGNFVDAYDLATIKVMTPPDVQTQA